MKKNVRRVLLCLFSIIFLFSLYKVGTYYYGTYINKKTTAELISSIKDDNGRKMSFSQKYGDLLRRNSDFVGWISIEDTQLDYPVMHTPKNEEYYLRKNFDKEYEFRGTLFLNANANLKNRDDNIIIYGHNMDDGTMFGTLRKYAKYDYYTQHKIIKFETKYETSEYEIAYVFKAVDEIDHNLFIDYYTFYNAGNEEEFNKQMNIYANASFYNTGITPKYNDHLITLSTCEYSNTNGRLVVIARKIEK